LSNWDAASPRKLGAAGTLAGAFKIASVTRSVPNRSEKFDSRELRYFPFGKGGLRGISSDLRGDCFGKNLPLPLFFSKRRYTRPKVYFDTDEIMGYYSNL
jgi:hypothetical protein